jgi:tetratricopeptide (TPR) repeat protein
MSNCLHLTLALFLVFSFAKAQKTEQEITTASNKVLLEEIEMIAVSLTKQLNENPENIKLRENRARAYLMLEKYDLAIRDYNILIAQNNNKSTYYYGRGLSKLSDNQIQKACLDFKKAKQLNYDFTSSKIIKLCGL